ncbi:MAG: cadmium-translocating P-type ATPase [Ignavibacteria bacterium]|nr:cadmium-translocating P-type ATPase [Ignavibacteria bacterium]
MNVEQTTTYHLEGLCCAEEEQLIRKKLGGLHGIGEIKCNLISRTLTVHYMCSQDEIARSLKEIGFAPRIHQTLEEPKTSWQRHNQLFFAILSGLLLATGFLFSTLGLDPTLVVIVFILSMMSGGWRIAIKALKAGKHFSLDMNFLMVIATLGAAAIGKWEEGASVIFLFSVSHILERFSMDRSRKAIQSLMSLSPVMAIVKSRKGEQLIRVEEISVGEELIIKPGERIPLDGVVTAGESTVNQAPITGESAPVRKIPRDSVYAGSLNERGTLEMKVSKKYYDTTLARIVRIVEEAHTERAPIQHFADRFARIYTPMVIGLALVLAVGAPLILHASFSLWFYRALVLLVIACPCALVISTPVTILSGLSNAARHGILVKGGRYLEQIGSVSVVAFDKTGTLTEGIPRVTDVIPLDSLSREQILQLTAAIEEKSEHHLASAIIQKASEEQTIRESIAYQHFEALTGRGVRAGINGITYIVGNHTLIEEMGICSPKIERILCQLESEGKTTIILGTQHKSLGIIAITDEVRRESSTITQQLHAQGVKKTIMLTGDNEGTAQAIAAQTRIDEYVAGIMPEEKVSRVKMLIDRYGSVAMVGDGINDAPALAVSTVGIAMGTAGADITLETADVVLMSDDLSKLPTLMTISKQTLSLIKQNIVIALCTKLVFLLLGVAGLATLWMAVLADDGATLLVILNGLRALRKPAS